MHTRNSSILISIILCLVFKMSFSQTSDRYSKEPIFTDNQIQKILDIRYGVALNRSGDLESLDLDLYFPDTTLDTENSLPLILYVHGGSFKSGSKQNTTAICTELAKRGYIVATINYRLGWASLPNCNGDINDFDKAFYRSVQDAKASLRFLVGNASMYKIDTTNIFIAGVSAGAATVLHTAFADQNEMDSITDYNCTLLGGINDVGNTYTNVYTIKGVANDRGGIFADEIIDSNEKIPTVSFHGTMDDIVPIETGPLFGCTTLSFYQKIFGSEYISNLFEYDSINFELNYYPDGNHTNIFYSTEYIAERIAEFFKSVMNENIHNVKQIQALYASALVSPNSLCPENFSESVQIQYEGGSAPYQYSIDGITYQESNTFTLTASGNYIGYIKDSLQNVAKTDTIFIASLPVPEIAVDLPENLVFCEGNTVALSANDLRDNVIWNTGETTDSILINESGDYSYSFTNENGCIAHSNVIHVTKSSLGEIGITNDNDFSFCEGDVTELIAPENLTSYSWNTGETGNRIQAYKEGIYYVTVTNEFGCSKTSAEVTVKQNNLPIATKLYNDGSTTFCKGGSINFTAIYEGDYIHWFKDGIDLGFSADEFIATESGSYSFTVYNACGSSSSESIDVVVNKLPTAKITASGSTVLCGGSSVTLSANAGDGLSYQWYKDNISVAGANSRSYSTTSSGIYKCYITNSGTGCSKFSNKITVSTSCRQSADSESEFTIYPNPVSENLIINIPQSSEQTLLFIFNDNGDLLIQKIMGIDATTSVINMHDLPSGVYLVLLQNATYTNSEKIVKE